jgi:NifU-like protein
MDESIFVNPSKWALYSKKLREKIIHPSFAGIIEETKEGMCVVIGEEAPFLKFALLINEADGQIIDVKFQSFGESVLVGIAEMIGELILRKNYDQAGRITADLIETSLKDHSKKAPFSNEAASYINIALGALDNALEKCKEIPLPEGYVETPVDLRNLGTGEYPVWEELTDPQRIALISEVIAIDIRPYVELDEGGVEVKSMEGEATVVIGYEGSCTTCYSATGSTLNAIQQILRAKVHPKIIVKPDLGTLMQQS